jgi:hypothetical protein
MPGDYDLIIEDAELYEKLREVERARKRLR